MPPLRARVTDLTATLSADQRAALEQRLAALETAKGSQVAILMVPTVQPEAIEQYSIRVFDQWKLGRKNVDDGVLLLVAKNDRKLRIEVGRGLEGAIPDAYAKRIIDEEITPRFKQGDFFGGISAGVERIAKLVQGEPMPPPARSPASRIRFDPQILIFGFVVIAVLANVLHALLGRGVGSGVVAAGAAALAYAIVGALAVAAIIGVIVFVVSLFIGAGSGRGSGWSSGGWSSGGGGFGGGGGGGFSGGGGGSSGGGASGSW